MPEQSSQEKTEDATPRRLREARDKGQVPKSRDISQVFVLIVTIMIFAMTLAYVSSEFQLYFKLCFERLAEPEITGATLWDLGKAGLYTMAKALLPLGGHDLHEFRVGNPLDLVDYH